MWFRKLAAFIKRDFQTEKSYRLAFVMRFATVFFTVATFFFIAKLFGKNISPVLKDYGGDYFSFVLIGLAFSAFLTVGLNSFSRSISTAQAQGTLEAILVTPTRLIGIVLYSSIWSFLFTSITAITYLVLGSVVFGADFTKANFLGALVILGLTILLFSGIGVLSASFIMVFKKGDPVNWLFSSASSLVGGAFFPIAVLPVWLQKISYLFPLFYALKAMRQALLLGYSFKALSSDILILTLMTAVILPLSILIFSYAVKQAKIDGSLGTY
ncbi:hypothetical protein LCGC14_1282690 [marine sediment metagenome]|uniref:ABC transmembrane type-2 domain-containing protein n=1 Tax=marine sediment metagenome TaxID=412755 RepID=A0A0F9LFU3_9ZZZZ